MTSRVCAAAVAMWLAAGTVAAAQEPRALVIRVVDAGGGFVPIYPRAPRMVSATLGVVF